MAVIETQMTPEELKNNYEYKVVRRALMREYPWIKDVTFDPEDLDQYNLIFLNLIVDPIKMGESYGYKLNSWIMPRVKSGEKYSGNYPSLIFDVPWEEAKDSVTEPINQMFEEIHNSPALPADLRLPKGRVFRVGMYTINPDGPEWITT